MISRFNKYDKEISELYETTKEPTQIARKVLKTDEGGSKNKEVKLLSEYIRRHIRRITDAHDGFFNATSQVDIPITSARNMWIKTQNKEGLNFSVLAKNPFFVDENAVDYKMIETAIDNVLSNFNKEDYIFNPNQNESNLKAIKVTISDDHVGLEPNPNGNGLFKYEYNGEIYSQSYEKVFKSVVKEFNTHGKFDLLLLDNLGDEQDGWNGLTTRGGHELSQNMSNAEVFETCIDVKVKMIKSLVENNIANKIILRKVANDNHSGDFGHTINLAVKKIINLIYSTEIIEVETLTQFLEHRIYGDHCFILTHGKDAKQMFRGLPLKLDDKTINYINDYIRFYDIKSKYIHVEKGDLHQIGYNKCNTFDYRNFMSFAPPSSWVQHNFGDCYSGYSIQVIPKFENEISHTDYFLDYKKLN
jgi:hypothetical protein